MITTDDDRQYKWARLNGVPGVMSTILHVLMIQANLMLPKRRGWGLRCYCEWRTIWWTASHRTTSRTKVGLHGNGSFHTGRCLSCYALLVVQCCESICTLISFFFWKYARNCFNPVLREVSFLFLSSSRNVVMIITACRAKHITTTRRRVTGHLPPSGGVDPEGSRGSWLLKICRRGQSMLWPPKLSQSFIQNCCWITLRVSHH